MASQGVGIDVSKEWLDIAITGGKPPWRVPNTDEGYQTLLADLKSSTIHRVVLEASGGYEVGALLALQQAGLPMVRVQPLRARHFARGLGRRAKTDSIDAWVLARMAQVAVDELPLWKPLEETVADLKSVVERRQQLVVQRDAEKKRLRQARSIVRGDLEASIQSLTARIKLLESKRDDLVASDAELCEDLAEMESVSGVGRGTAATLRVIVPELGTLSRGEVAALVGVAPMNRDSGKQRGRRYIQGGRTLARNSLYMAILSAVRWNPVIREFYKRLLKRKKKPKTAMVACMRKLIIYLNSRMRILRNRPTESAPASA